MVTSELVSFWKKFYLILKPLKINNFEVLELFFKQQIASISGKLIMKYSQRRLGKIHYKITKSDEYAKELIKCQVVFHKQICIDFFKLLIILLKLEEAEQLNKIRKMFILIHKIYVDSAPDGLKYNSTLHQKELLAQDINLAEIATETGKFLFKILPFNEALYDENKIIFQGQVRLAYIQVLEKLAARINKQALIENITHN